MEKFPENQNNNSESEKPAEKKGGFKNKLKVWLGIGATATALTMTGCGKDANATNNVPTPTVDDGPKTESNIEDAGITTSQDIDTVEFDDGTSVDVSGNNPGESILDPSLENFIIHGVEGTVAYNGVVKYGDDTLSNLELNEKCRTYTKYLIDWDAANDYDTMLCKGGFLDFSEWAESFNIDEADIHDEGRTIGDIENGRGLSISPDGIGLYCDGEQKYQCLFENNGHEIDMVGLLNSQQTGYTIVMYGHSMDALQISLMWYASDMTESPFEINK